MTIQATTEIYSGGYCPYCSRAKALLKKKGAPFTEYDVQADPKHREAMMARTNNARTIPQIFINGQHIGGCDELYALDKKGELDPLLQTTA
ncbi:MAG: glutaredoxin 3 [Mariprofundales bacterium]|nr:glutaredoxin 3 [Mariprofundales bacterium]